MRAFPQLFRDIASHKRSVVVDLRTDAGRARALALAAEHDVFCEGWRPGVADRLGVGYDAIRAVNPAVIYCSISGYGQTGPLVARPGHDLNYQALAGAVAARPGDETGPAIPRVPIADLAAANVAALLICAAWAKRLQTGEGERIDVSMADVIASWVGPHEGTAHRDADEPVRGSPGYGVFETADGEVSDARGHLRRPLLGGGVRRTGDRRAARPRTTRSGSRASRSATQRVAAAVARLDRDAAIARLADAGAPVAPVLTPSEAGSNAAVPHRGRCSSTTTATPAPRSPAGSRVHPVRPPGPAPEPDSG